MKYIKRFIFWGGLISIIIGGIFGAQYLPAYLKESTFQPGLRLLDGTPVEGISQVIPNDAKVIILVYFRASCHACHQHLAILNNIHRPPVFVVALSVGDSQRAVEKMVNELGLKFPVLVGLPPEEAKDFGGRPLTSVPYTFLATEEDYAAWYGAGISKEALDLLERYK